MVEILVIKFIHALFAISFLDFYILSTSFSMLLFIISNVYMNYRIHKLGYSICQSDIDKYSFAFSLVLLYVFF